MVLYPPPLTVASSPRAVRILDATPAFGSLAFRRSVVFQWFGPGLFFIGGGVLGVAERVSVKMFQVLSCWRDNKYCIT